MWLNSVIIIQEPVPDRRVVSFFNSISIYAYFHAFTHLKSMGIQTTYHRLSHRDFNGQFKNSTIKWNSVDAIFRGPSGIRIKRLALH